MHEPNDISSGKALRVDEFLRLDVGWLKKSKYLDPDGPRFLDWTFGGEIVAVGFLLIEPTEILLSWSCRRHQGPGRHPPAYPLPEWAPVVQSIDLATTTQHFGGERSWFLCPTCGLRKGVLLGRDQFQCRSCWGATYPSQYRERIMNVLERASAVRRRLGGSGSVFDEPFPEKPTRMRWETYWDLKWADERAHWFWVESLAALVGRLEKKGGYDLQCGYGSASDCEPSEFRGHTVT